jgi:hypothetical protein
MLKFGVAASGLLLFFACKDTPYQERKEPPVLEQTAFEFNGVVEIGTPD